MAAHVSVDGEDLVVTITGWDRLWAVARRLRMPLSKVLSARSVNKDELPSSGFRVGGTFVPGAVQAGRFWSTRGKSFWVVRGERRVLAIECDSRRYARIVLEVPDPEADAARIMAAL